MQNLVGKPLVERPVVKSIKRWDDDYIKTDIREVGCEDRR
jgi:hypothetical protein